MQVYPTIAGNGEESLFREDTYLICALEKQEAPAPYSDITWEEETGQLVVSYEDGSQRCYQWDGTEFTIYG